MAGGENPELVIDKEGTWLYNGQPIVNKAIYLFFNQNLEYSPAGGYQVRVGAEFPRLRWKIHRLWLRTWF